MSIQVWCEKPDIQVELERILRGAEMPAQSYLERPLIPGHYEPIADEL